MLRTYIFIFIFFAGTAIVYGQTDTIYIVTRKGVDAHFAFKKSANLTQVRSYSPASFPVYSMTRSQHNRIRDLLYNFVFMETNYELLRKNFAEKDSVYQLKEATLTHAYQTQELRAKNFEDSYNNLLGINKTLDADLKKCEKLAKDEHKKRNRNTLKAGIVGVLVGFLVGAVL
jgi:hypothetical protein